MRFHNIFDRIFQKKSHLKILRFFILHGKDASIREISREIKITHPNVSASLKDLEREGILGIKFIGRSSVYSLNTENIFVKKVLTPLFAAEKDMQKLLSAVIISDLKFSYESIILFGSIARGEEKPKSDIDIAVILKAKEDKQAVLDELLALSQVTSRKLGNMLSPVIYYGSEFTSLYKKNSPLIKNILKEGKVLAGKSLTEIIMDN
jgi:predicted nucleotidyltransferase